MASPAAPALAPTSSPAAPALAPSVEAAPAAPSRATVASVVAATHLGYKRRRSGTHVVPATAQAAAAPPPVAAPVAAPIRAAAAEPPAAKLRRKTAGLGPKAAKKALGGVPAVKKVTSRKKPAPKPQIDDPPPAAHDVLDEMEERMLKIKEAKAWKELMVEEKEHMMMSKKDMDEDQLRWWKEYKEDIAERKRIFRGASSTRPSDTPMSGVGDGGVEDSTTDAYGGGDDPAGA